MLDGRLAALPQVHRIQSQAAAILFYAGISADLATIIGAAVGVISGAAFASGTAWLGILLLLASAALDGIDGTLAREFGGATAWGGVMDLSADRLVEAAVVIGIAWRRPELHFPTLILVASWYVNITVFLAVGAALERRGPKLIEYPPGILERTEVIIFLVLLAISGSLGPSLCYLFTALEILTGAQRLLFGYRQLESSGGRRD